MIIRFSRHAQQRLALRKISKRKVEDIAQKSSDRFYDMETRHLIAVQSRSRAKAVIVAYQDALDERWIITAHPMSRGQIARRIQRGRWIKL